MNYRRRGSKAARLGQQLDRPHPVLGDTLLDLTRLLAGVDVELAWRRCDSGTALEASGDLIHTGPTGTNVGDILIGINGNARRIRDPGAVRVL